MNLLILKLPTEGAYCSTLSLSGSLVLQSDAASFKSRMERMMGMADEGFRGKDLATLIRNKYGRSYDVQLIKKVFLLNVPHGCVGVRDRVSDSEVMELLDFMISC